MFREKCLSVGETSPFHSLTWTWGKRNLNECNRLISTVIIAIGSSMSQTVEIHIRLLNEGTEYSRPTQALDLGHGLLKVLPTANYDPEDEAWEFRACPKSQFRTRPEFPPDSIVRSEVRRSDGREFLVAVAP
jgi:hypothetical protein